jgi:hypothetical protein
MVVLAMVVAMVTVMGGGAGRGGGVGGGSKGLTVQSFFASFLRLGLENIEDCCANDEIGKRADDQR